MQSIFSCIQTLSKISMFGLLLALCACVKTTDYLRCEFPQDDYKLIDRTAIKNALRSATIYDEFITKASFDILWFSNAVAKQYALLHGKRRGATEQKIEAHTRRLCDDNNDMITFYVLADIRSETNQLLSDPKCIWNMFIRRPNSAQVIPQKIKRIEELEPELVYFFGPLMSDFKETYAVTFPAHDVQGNRIVTAGEPIILTVRSAARSVNFAFNVGDTGNITDDVVIESMERTLAPGEQNEDFYWM